MFGRLFMTILLMSGVLFPAKFIKITEFWKLGNNAPSDKTIVWTRVLSVVAIVLIWFMPMLQ